MIKLAKKVISVLLILSVMMGFVGCAFFDKIHVTMDSSVESISAPELVRLLVSAVNDEKNLADSYAAIPEHQRKDVSYSTYFEYVSLLRELSSRNGKIVGFDFLNNEENSEHLNYIYSKLEKNSENVEDYRSVFAQYGSVRTVSFDFLKENSTDVFMYISFDDKENAMLSNILIMHTLGAYNYMHQYFRLLDEKKTDGISALMELGSDVPEEFYNSILNAKADFYVDFYNLRVTNSTSQFQLTEANPLYVDYRIPKVLTADNTDFYDRHIQAFRNPSGLITISDVIPQDTDISITTVNINQSLSLRCGLEYDYSAVNRICGKPISMYLNEDVVIDEITDIDGNVTDIIHPLLISYNGMNLVFNAKYKSDKEWIGELVSIRLFSSSSCNYPVCGIRVGDSELKIMERFPMIDYGNYDFDYRTSYNGYHLKYEINNKLIEGIVISKADKESD